MRVGFISTRFAGTDGVSLEACKWAEVLEQNGHPCFWFAGQLQRPVEKSFLVPEAHFQHEKNARISDQVLGRHDRSPMLTRAIHSLRARLKIQIHEFVKRFEISLLIVENALTIPMHVPLGLALTEAIAETGLPTIAHHHDFYWERGRFTINAVGDYLRMAFPPNLPRIRHAVINSEAREQLALRTGITAQIIPNVLDFDQPPRIDARRASQFRASIGLAPEDRIILQPTRVVQRKGIEHAVALVSALGDPKNKLVISHEAGDEGFDYVAWLTDHARRNGVDLRLVSRKIEDPWMSCPHAPSGCSLWDVYPIADFITFPSLYEGFGNAFLEAVFFRKPILINRYATFVRDIEPLGFHLAVMDGYLSQSTVDHVRRLVENPRLSEKTAAHNFAVAARHYSYNQLRKGLNALIGDLFEDTVPPLKPAMQPESPTLRSPPAACDPAACGDCRSFCRALS